MASDKGEEGRFSELLGRHRGIIFKVANTYCRNRADREELAQEIATQLWRAFPSFDSERAFPTWMYRIALNVAISFVRSRARERHTVALDESHDRADASGDEMESDERVALLYRFIDELDPLNRALLLLYMDDRSYREIANILGITETNVATKISRLKQRISKQSSTL